jgi:hypothetical protein
MTVSARIVILFVAFAVDSASAYRREYRVTVEGSRKHGSEVCFYRGSSAADPFTLFFSHDRVSCLSADDVLDLPPGLFHVFARHREGYASAHRDYFVYRGAPAPEAGYEIFDIPLEPAAVVDVSALIPSPKSGESVGIWLAPTPRTRGTYIPLVNGETSILVPARMPFVPLRVAGQQPIAIGTPTELEAGGRLSVTKLDVPRDRSDVIVWTKTEAAGATRKDGLRAPEVVLESDDRTFQPLFPLHDPLGATHTLLFFRDVPLGIARLSVRGKTWMPMTKNLIVKPGVTVEKEPVLLTASAALTAFWDLAPVGIAPPEKCQFSDADRPQVTAVLLRCAPDNTTDSCQVVGKRATSFQHSGAVTFEGLPSGPHRLKVELPFADPIVKDANLVIGHEERVDVTPDAFTFFGTVTLNRKAVQTRLIFESGEAYSDEAGAYTAVLGADPLTNFIQVVVCGDGLALKHIPREKIRRNSRYDIEIEVRDTVVTVTDRYGKFIEGASVDFAPLRNAVAIEPVRFYTSPPKVTGSDGRAVFANIPAKETVLVCAKHRDFTPTCTSPIPPDQLDSAAVRIRMEPIALRGRVAAHRGTARLAVVDVLGRITEETSVNPDGTFLFKLAHHAPEYLVYASDGYPLVVFSIPAHWPASDELVVTFPPSPVRSFEVGVQPMKHEAGFIGVWVGGHYVPLQLLAFHQEMLGLDARVYRRNARLRIRDILEVGAIDVAFAPEDRNARVFVDVFTQPEYAGVARHRIAGETVTITP